MIDINLFLKKYVYFNAVIGEIEGKYNMPKVNQEFNLYKGIDNVVNFTICNHDRVPIVLENNFTLKLVLTNEKKNIKIEKTLSALPNPNPNVPRGKFSVSFTKQEITDYLPLYIGSIIKTNTTTNETEFLYVSEQWNPYFTVTVYKDETNVPEAVTILTLPENSIEVPHYDIGGQLIIAKYTSNASADISNTHTFAIKYDATFTGIITIQGSIEQTPQQSDEDWVTLGTPITVLTGAGSEQIISQSFVYNLNWVRVKIEQNADSDTGNVTEITYRN